MACVPLAERGPRFVVGIALMSACSGPGWDGFGIDGAWDGDLAAIVPRWSTSVARARGTLATSS